MKVDVHGECNYEQEEKGKQEIERQLISVLLNESCEALGFRNWFDFVSLRLDGWQFDDLVIIHFADRMIEAILCLQLVFRHLFKNYNNVLL